MPAARLTVDVLRLRAEGWLLPRFRLCMLEPARGVLVLREEPVPALNRHMRVARLQACGTGPPVDKLPPLRDACLIHMSGVEWVLTGFERVRAIEREIDYAQTWLVTPVAVEISD